MDKVELGILKELLVNNGVPPGTRVLRKSFRSMAKDLGVDQGTIRSRIKKFQEQGVLRGWYLGNSPGITGQSVIYAWLRVEPEAGKEEVIEKLLSVENIERVCNYFGPKVSLILLHKNESNPDSALERLASLTGLGESVHLQAAVRVPPYEIKRTDAALIDVLRRDPWIPDSVAAKAVGISAKSVKRRVTGLSEDGVIYTLPIIDLKALQGIIPMELAVDYASLESRAEVNGLIVSRVRENLVFSNYTGPYGYFALAVPNISQVELITRWVRRLKGVRDARSDALQDVVLNRKHYESRRELVKLEPEGKRVSGLAASTTSH
ncbi:MAG: Lrp/AsnC family transcriptional regulator [Nitrososphaerales archaeon]